MKSGLIYCKVAEDLKNYEFWKSPWESLRILTQDTLDLRTVNKHLDGKSSTWVMCFGEPKYNNPQNEWKAME